MRGGIRPPFWGTRIIDQMGPVAGSPPIKVFHGLEIDLFLKQDSGPGSLNPAYRTLQLARIGNVEYNLV